MSKIPWKWNLRTVPYKGQSELDREIYEYLSEIALSSDEERQRLVQVYHQFEAARPSPGLPPRIEKCSDEEARTIYSEAAERELLQHAFLRRSRFRHPPPNQVGQRRRYALNEPKLKLQGKDARLIDASLPESIGQAIRMLR